ncbi:MAG: hypothetical protein ACOX2O_01270 [Bdellovibrionota bacterium]|jgi:hypothetical protein
MASLETLQLVADVLLVLSLFYLCARSAKVSPILQSSNLEASLRRMVQEADLATRALQEKLVQRQTRLEELLLDLESAENRLNRGKQSIDETRADLESRFVKAQRAIQTLQNQIDLASDKNNVEEKTPLQQKTFNTVEENFSNNLSDLDHLEIQTAAEKRVAQPDHNYTMYGRKKVITTPSQEASLDNHTPKKTSVRKNIYGAVIDEGNTRQETLQSREKKSLAEQIEKETYTQPTSAENSTLATPKKTGVRKNIYGEIIDEGNIAQETLQSRAKKPLAEQIEKETYTQATYKQNATAAKVKNSYGGANEGSQKGEKPTLKNGYQNTQDIQRVYDNAEDLLRDGNSMEAVAQLTELPIAEVRMLAQMLERVPQQIRTTTNESESRLGVLDPIRRQLQTV